MTKRILYIVVALVVCAGIVFIARRPPLDIRLANELANQWRQVGSDQSDRETLVRKSIQLAENHPQKLGAMIALRDAVSAAGSTPAGKKATIMLEKRILSDPIEVVVESFPEDFRGGKSLKRVTTVLLTRVKANLDHPKASSLLCAIGRITSPSTNKNHCDPVYADCAELIEQHFVDQPDLFFFTEQMFNMIEPSRKWAIKFEPLLVKVIENNPDRASRCSAAFALARVLHVHQDRQDDAEDAYAAFCSEFDGTKEYHFNSIERTYHGIADDCLSDLRHRRAGMPAPNLSGVDLDGKTLSLRDYRGTSVLVSFWASWCNPCMKMIEHEQELLEKFRDRPFDILGVNADDDVAAARRVRKDFGMDWRSLVNKSWKPEALSAQWNVLAFPTFYLVDHHGVIRKSWIGTIDPSELEFCVESLVSAAESQSTVDEMNDLDVHVKLASPTVSREFDASVLRHVQVRHHTAGQESNFAIYVPPKMERQREVSLIVFLHGAGARGRNLKQPLDDAMPLLRMVHRQSGEHPVFVLIPQADDDESWTAEDRGGRKALAILDQVIHDFPVDPDRVVLTGMSMGGQGTWSLAANYTNRFAAIVPICHGGNPEDASRLATIPCWCFHGAADPMIHVSQSREMIKAINREGGRAIYSELAGVGHEEAADRAYESPELFDWIIRQRKKSSP